MTQKTWVLVLAYNRAAFERWVEDNRTPLHDYILVNNRTQGYKGIHNADLVILPGCEESVTRDLALGIEPCLNNEAADRWRNFVGEIWARKILRDADLDGVDRDPITP